DSDWFVRHRSVLLRKEDSEDAPRYCRVRRVRRAVLHLGVVIINLPIQRLAVELEYSEIVLAVRVVIRPEVAEIAHRSHGSVNELVAVCGNSARDDKLAVGQKRTYCGVGRAHGVVKLTDAQTLRRVLVFERPMMVAGHMPRYLISSATSRSYAARQ